MYYKRTYRILCALLCLTMLSGFFSFRTVVSDAEESARVSVHADGRETSAVAIERSEKRILTAYTVGMSGALSYRWQILADSESEQWVNIYDAEDESLAVSYALVYSVLDGSDSAYVRAAITDETGLTRTSSPVCVTVINSLPAHSSAYKAQSARNIAVFADDTESDDDMILISVKYLDAVSGHEIYTAFYAQINKGSTYKNKVVSPTYLGYKPYYNKNAPAIKIPAHGEVDAPDEALEIDIDIGADYSESEYTVNVYYKASDVSWAARYFFQNVNNDFYTEDSSVYKQGTAKTGTIISDAELAVVPASRAFGFTKLYHYPEAVAADGSTVFECYYDRNYSMLKFDLDGGYGSDPVYARYETPFFVNKPTKHGYVFMGWDLQEGGVYDGVADELPSTMPATSRSYRAIWREVDTQYTVAYWLIDPDDDDYNYLGHEKIDIQSGKEVFASDCMPSSMYSHYDRIEYDEEKTISVNKSITVNGDGSSVLNIYYKRKYYTLRFVYAKEYNGAKDVNADRDPNNTFRGIRYDIAGGSTYGFGNKDKSWPKDSDKNLITM